MIINNDRGRDGTREAAEQFAQTAARMREAGSTPGVEQWMFDGMIEMYEGEALELHRQADRYEHVKSGTARTTRVRELHQLYVALVEARLARGWTQKQLAEAVGVHEQQIQRWEQDDYQRTTFHRLLAVASVLGVKWDITATLPRPPAKKKLRGDQSAPVRPKARRPS